MNNTVSIKVNNSNNTFSFQLKSDTNLLFAIYLIGMFILCITFNSILLFVLIYFKKPHTHLKKMFIITALLNLIGSIQFPFDFYVFFNDLDHRYKTPLEKILYEKQLIIHLIYNFKSWKAFELICIFNGYIHFVTGYFQIYALTSVSLIRYRILRKSLVSIKRHADNSFVLKAIGISMFLSLFWATLPILGIWSYYELSKNSFICMINSTNKNWNVLSYNLAIILFVFVVPFTTIAYTNIASILKVFLFYN